MSQTSGFFNAILVDNVPDRAYDAIDFAKYFASFIGDGVFAHNLNELKTVANSNNMSVTVKSGRAFLKGFWYNSDEDVDLIFNSNSESTTRWDAIVLRFNFSTSARRATLAIKTGTNARSYSAGKQYIYNNLSRDASGIYELCLAIVKIPANAVSYLIKTADIYDVRDEEYCGWVTGLVDQLDTSTIVTQLQAQFEIWFDAMKGQLSEDAAGHLQLEIDVISQVVNRYTPITLYEYDPENDDQIANNSVMTLSKSVLQYDELEFHVKGYSEASSSSDAHVAMVYKFKVPTTLSELRAAVIEFEIFNSSYTNRFDVLHAQYGFTANKKISPINSQRTMLMSYGSSSINAGIQTFEDAPNELVTIRVTKIVGIGDRNAVPMSFDNYNETQVDTIYDSVEEEINNG